MKIILTNGVELHPLTITGEQNYFQNFNRDTLSFIFSPEESVVTLDNAFSAEACESIRVIDDFGYENIHKGYTIRVKLEKKPIEIIRETHESQSVVEERIIVSMAQRTYAESQLASLTETVDVLVMESLMA